MTPAERDRNLNRVRHLTGWVAGAALAATGLFAGLAAAATKHTAAKTTTTTTTATTAAATTTQQTATPVEPTITVTPTQAPPVASSGGS